MILPPNVLSHTRIFSTCSIRALFDCVLDMSRMVSMENNAPCKVVAMGNAKIRMFDVVVRTLGIVRHISSLQ